MTESLEQAALFNSWDNLQAEIKEWSYRNFGDETEVPAIIAAVGLVEEVGEVCRCLLKREQGIRGTKEEWTLKLQEELGDVLIKVFDVAVRENMNVYDLLLIRWTEIKQRNWAVDKQGHGLNTES